MWLKMGISFLSRPGRRSRDGLVNGDVKLEGGEGGWLVGGDMSCRQIEHEGSHLLSTSLSTLSRKECNNSNLLPLCFPHPSTLQFPPARPKF